MGGEWVDLSSPISHSCWQVIITDDLVLVSHIALFSLLFSVHSVILNQEFSICPSIPFLFKNKLPEFSRSLTGLLIEML